jgi:hypothetical protein
VTQAPLKAQNMAWIWAVVIADALTLAAIAFPSIVDHAASWIGSGSRLASASIAPVVVLLLTSLVSPDLKAMLVFWRLREVLPGHRAFSHYAQQDARIDLGRLRAAVGEFPETSREQNTLWYRLFKATDSNPEVAQAHRHFLLFRELAALSLLLAIAAPIVLFFCGAGATAIQLAIALFAVQYLAAAIAARQHGIRLVCNVLALQGLGDPPKPKGRKPA